MATAAEALAERGLAATLAPSPERRRTDRRVAAVALALLALVAALLLAGRLGGLGDVAAIEGFVVVFAAIAIEALPFVLLGALVSAAIAVFVPDRVFTRAAELPLRVQVPGAILGGFAFPVCECGSVPVARRLILRGLHPAAGYAFMLAAPVVNPVVLISTAVAYGGRGALAMVLGRAALGVFVALVAGLAIARWTGGRDLPVRGARHGHDHSHAAGGSRRAALFGHLATDFTFMAKFVVAGAALAALAQTAVPQAVFSGILASPVVGALIMMLVAFILSLCSEADAFVAVSFVAFGSGAQLAFLAFGPVLDIKLALLYGATFGTRFVVKLVVLTVPLVLAGSLLFGWVAG